MTGSTKDLIEEHSNIMMMLKVMEQIAIRLERGEAVDATHLQQMVEYLENFTDKCHHGKEEDFLFPALLHNPQNQATINQLLGEHKTGRDLITGMAASLVGYQPGNADAMHIAKNIQAYVELIKDHIRKENEYLFQLADQQLPQEFSLSIQAQYDRFEEEMLGVGKYDQYQQWLRDLEAVYLAH